MDVTWADLINLIANNFLSPHVEVPVREYNLLDVDMLSEFTVI